MRLYLKLALIIAAAVVIHSAVGPAGRLGAWEAQFAARCWLAHQLQDAELQARLVEEAQERLVQDLKRAWHADLPVATVHAFTRSPSGFAGGSVAVVSFWDEGARRGDPMSRPSA